MKRAQTEDMSRPQLNLWLELSVWVVAVPLAWIAKSMSHAGIVNSETYLFGLLLLALTLILLWLEVYQSTWPYFGEHYVCFRIRLTK
jgi:hypothetical protein